MEGKSEDIPGVQKNRVWPFLPTPHLPVWGLWGLYFLVLDDCIFKLVMCSMKVTEHYLSYFQNEVLIHKKKKLLKSSHNIKLFCTVRAQTLDGFQIQYFTVLRALHFRIEWGVLGTCTVGQFRLPRLH